MRFVYLANNRVGLTILEWLMGRGDVPVALVVHPSHRASYRDEMIEVSGLAPERIVEAPDLRNVDTLATIGRLQPECGVSILFDYILQEPFLSLFPKGCVNLHPSLLPYNRGQYPNVWSIVEGTPAGVTLHFVDKGIDTGDVVAQVAVEVLPTDTGESLYRRLEEASIDLFKNTWPILMAGNARRYPQPTGVGSVHRAADTAAIDEIDLQRPYVARDLINILRARTFPPHKGAFFVEGGKRVYMLLHLSNEPE